MNLKVGKIWGSRLMSSQKPKVDFKKQSNKKTFKSNVNSTKMCNKIFSDSLFVFSIFNYFLFFEDGSQNRASGLTRMSQVRRQTGAIMKEMLSKLADEEDADEAEGGVKFAEDCDEGDAPSRRVDRKQTGKVAKEILAKLMAGDGEGDYIHKTHKNKRVLIHF